MQRTINLARIDLPSMRLVVQCARTGTLSEAARNCHMSISGASHKLQRLEDGLGEALFRRHRRGLEATRAGLAVVEAGKTIFITLEAMNQDLSRLQLEQ